MTLKYHTSSHPKLNNFMYNTLFLLQIYATYDLELIGCELSVQQFTRSAPHLKSRMRRSILQVDTLLAKWDQGFSLQTSHNT